MMNKMAWLGLGTFLLIMAAHESVAAPALDFSIHQPYISTRAMGMGNAFTAVADDHSAMFYNPAALARRENGNLHFFSVAPWILSFLVSPTTSQVLMVKVPKLSRLIT